MLKAIETRYDGCLFRSRLEARWATFFNALAVPYEYEKEGFDLGSAGWYLPDFWMPQQDCWIEIKPVVPTPDERWKAGELADQSGKHVYICYGEIPRSTADARHWIGDGAEVFFINDSWDNFHLWVACPKCGKKGLTYEGRADYLCDCWDYKISGEVWAAVDLAYEAARSARFEHDARPMRPVRRVTL